MLFIGAFPRHTRHVVNGASVYEQLCVQIEEMRFPELADTLRMVLFVVCHVGGPRAARASEMMRARWGVVSQRRCAESESARSGEEWVFPDGSRANSTLRKNGNFGCFCSSIPSTLHKTSTHCQNNCKAASSSQFLYNLPWCKTDSSPQTSSSNNTTISPPSSIAKKVCDIIGISIRPRLPRPDLGTRS